MDPSTISVEPTAPAADTINMAQETSPVSITPPVAERRANMAETAFPEMKNQDWFGQIMQGNEQNLRNGIAIAMDAKKNQYRDQALSQIALKKGGNLTPAEKDYITQLISGKPHTEPQSVFEEYYSTEWLAGVKATADVNWMSNLKKAILDEKFYGGRDWMSMQELIKTQMENMAGKAGEQSFLGNAVDFLKGFIPLHENLALRSTPGSIFSKQLSTDLAEQAKQYFDPNVPFSVRRDKLLTDLKAYDSNPHLGVRWLGNMLGQSADDAFWNNFWGATDILATPGIGALVKGAKALKTFKALNAEVDATIKSAVRDSISAPPNTSSILSAAGNLPEAGIMDATKKLVELLKPEGPVSSVTGLSPDVIMTGQQLAQKMLNQSSQSKVAALQSYFNQSANLLGAKTGSMTREFVNRQYEQYVSRGDEIMQTIYDSIKVEGLSALKAVEGAVRKVADKMIENYPGLENKLLDAVIREDPAGLNSIEIQLGQEGNKLFSSNAEAKRLIKQYLSNEPTATIETKGAGYYIRLELPLDVTSNVIRDGLLATGDTHTPMNWLNGSYVGKFRTPEETQSYQQLLNRKAATYGISKLTKIAKSLRKEIDDMVGFRGAIPWSKAKTKWGDWNRVIEDFQKFSPKPGYFDDIPELEQSYMRLAGRLPDAQEVRAAIAWKQMEETHTVLSKLQEYRNLHRLGAREHSFWVGIPEMETARTIYPKYFKFNGTRVSEIPKNGDYGVLIVAQDRGSEVIRGANALTKAMQDDIKTGRRIAVRVSQPWKREFDTFSTRIGEDPVNFVLIPADRYSVSNLQLSARRVRPLSHDYEGNIVQPDVRYSKTLDRHIYYGDKNIAVTNIRKIGQNIAKNMDKVRDFIAKGNEDGAAITHEAGGLPLDFRTMRMWFGSQGLKDIVAMSRSITEEGLPVRKQLNREERIQYVPRGKRSIDMHNELQTKYGGKFIDATKAQGEFFHGGRDIDDIFAIGPGTKGNPLYNVSPVKYLDPSTSINRAITHVINSNFLEDYKNFAVEHWIAEAIKHDALDATPAQIRSAPYYYFHKASLHYNRGLDAVTRNSLNTVNLQIKQFLGLHGKETTFLHSMTQQLIDSLYEKGSSKAAAYISESLPYLRDPFAYMRAMTYHEKLGLFNPAQLLVQMNTFANIYGIAGFRAASSGTAASILHLWSSFNRSPEVLAHMDKLATNFGFRPGEWTEANKFLHASGILNVGTEHAYRDTPNFLTKNGMTFLNLSDMFFQGGSKSTRTAAGYTAYKEFRTANPTKKLTQNDMREILNRADLLDNNMTRASSSILHQGVFSIASQFQTYALRQMELFTGKRLTPAEKIRLFAVHSALYGIPIATGLTGMPFPDLMRKQMIEEGYVAGQDLPSAAIAEGLISTMIALATGKADVTQGYLPNVGERFGPSVISPLRDMLRSDKTWYDVVKGASGTSIGAALESLDPYAAAFMGYFRGEDQDYKMSWQDYLKPFQEISSVNNAVKLYYAVNTAKNMSKNEAYISDIDTNTAIFQSLTGLSEQKVSDQFVKGWIRKDELNAQNKAEKRFEQLWRRGIQSMSDDDPTQAAAYFKDAYASLKIADYPEDKLTELLAKTSRGYESMINNSDYTYFNKSVKESRKVIAREQELRTKQLGNKP
jgi:hypothetical protein